MQEKNLLILLRGVQMCRNIEHSCTEDFPNDPKYWCEECLDHARMAAEYQCEGDR
jgi:hypothetical protein